MFAWSLSLLALTASVVLGILLLLSHRANLLTIRKPPPPGDCALRTLVSTFSSLNAWGYGPALDALGTTYGIAQLSHQTDARSVRDSIRVGEVATLLDDLDQFYRTALAAQRTTV